MKINQQVVALSSFIHHIQSFLCVNIIIIIIIIIIIVIILSVIVVLTFNQKHIQLSSLNEQKTLLNFLWPHLCL